MCLKIHFKHDELALVLDLVDAIGLLLEEVDVATGLLKGRADPFVKHSLELIIAGLRLVEKLVKLMGRSLDLTI